MLLAPSMTWSLVRIQPAGSKRNPDPTPVAGSANGFETEPPTSVVMVTTAGLTCAATSTMTAFGSGAPDAGGADEKATADGPADPDGTADGDGANDPAADAPG